MDVNQIIDRFGGLSAMTRVCGLKYPSVPQGWRARGTIPAHRIPALIEAAKKNNIELSLSDFFPRERHLRKRRGSIP